MPTYADVIAAALSDAGIEYIYGVPGSFSSIELIEAAAKRDIRYVLCSNESSAVVMASTYGVLRNRPGVCSTGLGPSAVAAVLGTVNALLEYAPCLILTDRYADAELRTLKRQRLDQNDLFQPIVKGTLTLTTDSATATLRHAIALTMAGRPGPVHIDLPFDVIQSEAPEEAFVAPQDVTPDALRMGPDHADLQAIASAIESAQRPAVIVGFQVNRSGLDAERAFVAFAEQLGAPVFASLAAKGTIPENHPLAMGTFRGARGEREALDRADLLVAVGLDVVELWAPGRWDYAAPVVILDEVPHSDGVIHPQVEAVGDLTESLRFLADSVSPCRGWNIEELDSYRKGRQRLLYPSGEGLMPGAVVRIARERLPNDGITTVDAGLHKVLVSDAWETRRPRGFHTSSGLGSMAVSLPAAMAAKMVEPQSPVLCFTGDGGLLMRLGDLEVAAREELAIVVVVFNDGYLNQIKIRQDERALQRLGTRFRDSDYVAVAQGLGFQAARVDTEEALDEALAHAFGSGRPWLVDARINPDGYL